MVFGDEKAWKRVKNVGLFSHQNFDKFFDWFVLTPTIDAVCAMVTGDLASSTKKSKHRMTKMKTKNKVRRRQSRLVELNNREGKKAE